MLTTIQVIMVFIIMVMSLLLSLSILLLECCWTKYEKRLLVIAESARLVRSREEFRNGDQLIMHTKGRRIRQISEAFMKTGDMLLTDVKFN